MFEKYIPMTEATCYILLSITLKKKHGYLIMQHVKEMTDGKITIGNGTLYGILNRMVEDGLITAEMIDQKKIYTATPLGKEILLAEQHRLKMLLKNFNTLVAD
ncbi:PadR family transcriptional regulator [Enterococcus sp. HY326]|uniref:PadR family transcriptional regulator n=1 Tax=Enterococcus sp. HY326 TaxID=2971265 RepID=UPI002240D1A3|nr:PadR family transcriptional regulator [Enterococcus sp. HY326]